MPADLLVTGATGFIGYYLAHLLAASGRYFRALVREGSDTTYLQELSDYCTLVQGDLNDPESLLDAVEGVDTVIHAAALVSYQAGDEGLLLHVNGEGTANLVNMMLEADTPRLVYLSSVAALNRVDGGPVTRLTDRWPATEPNTAYARSKFAAEREVWRGQAEGLSVSVLYPATVLGAGDWRGTNTPALWRRAAEGVTLYPEGAAGFVDVRDVALAALTAVDRRQDRERFLLSAANLSWREVLTAIADSIEAPRPFYGMPAWQSALLWPLEHLRSRLLNRTPHLTREIHRNLQDTFRYDGSAYPEITGHQYLPIAASITETGRAFKLSQSMDPSLPPTYLPLLDIRP